MHMEERDCSISGFECPPRIWYDAGGSAVEWLVWKGMDKAHAPVHFAFVWVTGGMKRA